jgi:hypothetical protein
MRVVEETWQRVYGNLINREKIWRGRSIMRGCEIFGRYISYDGFLLAFVFFCSWSHEHGGPRK